MIKSIHLENFQSHVDTMFTFSKGVNSIIGASDAGKTACIRALKWVATNRPVGDSFINHSSDFVRVTVETDCHTIIRERTSKTNTYELNGTSFQAVGTDVPQDVIDVLNLNNLNIQYQMDSPFLLTESPGEVARTINKVIKLDDIDSTLHNIGVHRRSVNKEVQSLAYSIAVDKENLTSLDCSEIERTLEIAEMLQETLGSLRDDILLECINDVIYIDDILVMEKSVQAADELAQSVYEQYKKMTDTEKQEYILADLIDNVEMLEERVEYLSPYLIDTEVIDTSIREYVTLCASMKLLEQLITDYTTIYDSPLALLSTDDMDTATHTVKEIYTDITSLSLLIAQIEEYEKIISSLDKEIHKIAKELGTTCPVCGGRYEILSE